MYGVYRDLLVYLFGLVLVPELRVSSTLTTTRTLKREK
jgi:hypothetical protein